MLVAAPFIRFYLFFWLLLFSFIFFFAHVQKNVLKAGLKIIKPCFVVYLLYEKFAHLVFVCSCSFKTYG